MMADLKTVTTWHKARSYCNKLNSDLAIFKDANMYAKTIEYIKKLSKYSNVFFYVTENTLVFFRLILL